jgi:hypothetical protein
MKNFLTTSLVAAAMVFVVVHLGSAASYGVRHSVPANIDRPQCQIGCPYMKHQCSPADYSLMIKTGRCMG